MRKIALLAISATAALLGLVSVAHAANTYTVNVASAAPPKAGTIANPKPTTINFGYQVGTTDGNRPSVTTDYRIGFGRNVRNGRRYFKGSKVCTIAQAGYAGGTPRCPSTARAGSGTVENLAGATSDPTQKIPCKLGLTLYVGDGRAVPAANNDGIPVRNDLVLHLQRKVPGDCPLDVNAGIPAGFVTVNGGTALQFHVKTIPFQNPAPGVDNSVVNVTSSAGKTTPVRTRVCRPNRTPRCRFVTKTRGLFETVGCTNRSHVVAVRFQDKSGSVSNAFKNAPCLR
jgi:hypothetical protein